MQPANFGLSTPFGAGQKMIGASNTNCSAINAFVVRFKLEHMVVMLDLFRLGHLFI
jgi:hypothetical protein